MTKTISTGLGVIATAIVAAAFLFTAQFALAATGPAGYWALNEGSGTTALDSSGNANNGAISGGAVYAGSGAPTPGNTNSLTSDGVDDAVTIPDAAALDISTAITVSGWVNLNSFSQPSTIAAKWRDISGANERGYLLAVGTDGTPRFYISTNGTTLAAAIGTTLTTGTWYHLLGTYDGATIKLYVNGTLVASTPLAGSIFLNSEPLLIGANDGFGGSSRKFTNGKVDEVQIYDRVLDAGEISVLANTSTTRFVDDDGQVGFGSIDCDGVGVGAYTTIQGGVDAASSGDTVQVCDGTYSEPIETLAACDGNAAMFCIDKPLMITGDPGAQGDTTADAGPGSTPEIDGGGAFASAFAIGSGVSSVTIEGFEVHNFANDPGAFNGGIGSAVLSWNTGASNITVQDNHFHDLGWNGVLAGSDDGSLQSGWVVKRNIISGADYAGIELTNTTDSEIAFNIVTIGAGITWDPGDSGVGIEVAVRDHGTGVTADNVSVHDNEVTGDGVAPERAGINVLSRAYQAASAALLTDVVVENNTVTGATRGVYVVAETRNASATASVDMLTVGKNIFSGNTAGVEVFDFVNGGGTPAHSDISVNRNSIDGNTDGMKVVNGVEVDGECNWWGDVSGPGPVGPGSGDKVSANVTFQPWLTSTDPDLANAPCDGPLPGSIVITKYECPPATIVTRAANGVGGAVPAGCVPQSGATFGYVHGSQTDANAPYPELGGPFTEGGATNGTGVLTIPNLLSTGRYLVAETDGSGGQLPFPGSPVLGLYCIGDGDTSGNNDNQELTFVPGGGTVNCVAYNKAPSATLTLEKIVFIDNGGTAVDTDWTLSASGPTSISGVEGDASITNATVPVGAYDLSESGGPSGYSASEWDCVANGGGGPSPTVLGPSVTLADGDDVICTITNDDQAAHLIVIKHVENDNGGTAAASAWTMNIGGVTATGGNTFSGTESPGTDKTLTTIGAYTVTETGGPSGYTESDSADCSGTIALGETKTCTITNDDNPGVLIVKKVIVNDNGGTKTVTAFSFKVNGGASQAFQSDGQNDINSLPGSYSVVENATAGYITTYSSVNGANCNGLVVAQGETVTCTITNDDVPPPPEGACSLPSVPGYTVQNGTAASNVVTLAPFTMFVGNGGNDTVMSSANGNYIVCTVGGNDTIKLSGSGAVTINAGNGKNTVVLGNMTGFITSGTGDDFVSAGNGARTIDAGNGKNTITTGSGNQKVTTGSGDDLITTNGGDDTIHAGAGKNKVFSKGGIDSLTALGGNDFFDAGAGADTCSPGGGVNIVINCAP